MPRTLVIGDIHGHLDALHTALDAAGVRDTDSLVVLGDLVDRGPDSRGVVDWAIERIATPGSPTVVIQGNHEELMLNARNGEDDLLFWSEVGGAETLASYADPIRAVTDGLGVVPDEHVAFLETLPLYHETERDLFVHGGVNARLAIEDHDADTLLWKRYDRWLVDEHASGKTVWCGHTPQPNDRPGDAGHTVCIDTGIAYDGYLTIADVDTRHYWQANAAGDVREGDLEPHP